LLWLGFIILIWPCILSILYTICTRPFRFILQTFCLLPLMFMTSIFCTLSGLVIKYFSYPFIAEAHRVWLLSFISASFFQVLIFICEHWTNTKLVFSNELGDKNMLTLDDLSMANLNAIFVCNHSASPLDWLVMSPLIDSFDRLPNLFVMMKKSFMLVPMIGWVMHLQNGIAMDRNWGKDKHKISTVCNRLASPSFRHVRPFAYFLYPEGTRFTNAKLLAAQQFAKLRGLSVYQHLLQPRVKGFSFVAHHLSESLGAIVDVTCFYHPRPPQILDFLLHTRLSQKIHLHLKVYAKASIPQCRDENDLSALDQWLRDRWTEKEQIMARLKKNEITHRSAHRTPWRATRYFVAWTVISFSFLFGVLFTVPWYIFCILLVTALFPVAIVYIQHNYK